MVLVAPAHAQDPDADGQAAMSEAATKMLLLGMAVEGPAAVVEKALEAKKRAEWELESANRDLDKIAKIIEADPTNSADFAKDQLIYQANWRVRLAKIEALDQATQAVLIVEKAAQAFEREQEAKKEAEARPQNCVNCAASLSVYIGEVSAAIRSRLFYPPAARARGAKGAVGVAFSIGPSGAVTSFAITRSSGDHDLDAAARSLVQGANFPPPPGGSAHISTSFNYSPAMAAAK
jgi:TonB family protein